MQRRRCYRFALPAAAALAFASVTFLLGLFFGPLPDSRLSLTRISAKALHEADDVPADILEIMELENGRWKIVFSRIDPEAEGSFKVNTAIVN